MSFDPFDEEEARRKALMDELFPDITAEELREQQADDLKRGKEFFAKKAATLDEIAKKLGDKSDVPVASDAFTRSEFIAAVEGLRERRIEPTYGDYLQQQREEEDRRYVRVGGWQAGKDGQDHEALRFEIEAERALFLGKPVPTDKELAAKHLELSALHVAYQKSGDASLLIGIADLSAEYKRMLADYAKSRPMAPKPPVIP